MNLQILRETKPVSKIPRACIWCREIIAAGEKHVHEVSIFDKELQDHRWHFECFRAMQNDYVEHHEEEFPAHSFKRGTNQEA
jgi:hypothetical protein